MQQDLNSNKATVWVIDPATNEVVPQPGGSDSIETTYTTHTLQRDQTDRVNDFTAPCAGDQRSTPSRPQAGVPPWCRSLPPVPAYEDTS
jgi:hypothetical protein